MNAIEEQFVSSDKVLANIVMSRISSMKYTGTSGACEHRMEMRGIATQQKALEVVMS